MLASVSLVALAASMVSAQTAGYGRFPCTGINGQADVSLCSNANLEANYQGTIPPPGYLISGWKSDQPVPVNTDTDSVECVQATGYVSGAGFFCGIAGAACSDSNQCDAGTTCEGGVCVGGLGSDCTDPATGELDDLRCLGLLYCNNFDLNLTSTEGCGGTGSFCQDKTVGGPTDTFEDRQANFEAWNNFCVSGYCNTLTAVCEAARFGAGESCASDPEFGCEDGLVCNADNICAPSGSSTGGARSRSRRALRERRSLCPASHTACSVAGTKSGFECIDTQSNLEQCGACSSSGGVDCTAIPGVEAVGCVAGVCEIWSCAEGFSWDAASSACKA